MAVVASPDTPGTPRRAVYLLRALGDDIERRAIEALLDGRPRPKRAVLSLLGADPLKAKVPDHVYRRLSRLEYQGILRVEGDRVELVAPGPVRAVRAVAMRAGIAMLRDELEEHEVALVADDRALEREPETVFAAAKDGALPRNPVDLSGEPWWLAPDVTWDIDDPAPDWRHLAARYRSRRHELVINGAFEPLVELREQLIGELHVAGAARELLADVLSREWEDTLVEVVVAARRYTQTHGLEDQLERRLSGEALTAAVLDSHVLGERIRRTYGTRRAAAR